MTLGAFKTSIHFFVMLQSPDLWLKRGRFLFSHPLLAINHTRVQCTVIGSLDPYYVCICYW